jgi:hypothetical protein
MILPSLLNTQHHLFVLNQEKIIHQINIMKVRLFHPRGCNIFASLPIMNFVTILLENLNMLLAFREGKYKYFCKCFFSH